MKKVKNPMQFKNIPIVLLKNLAHNSSKLLNEIKKMLKLDIVGEDFLLTLIIIIRLLSANGLTKSYVLS